MLPAVDALDEDPDRRLDGKLLQHDRETVDAALTQELLERAREDVHAAHAEHVVASPFHAEPEPRTSAFALQRHDLGHVPGSEAEERRRLSLEVGEDELAADALLHRQLLLGLRIDELH